MTLKEILHITGMTFETLLEGYIALSNAHPIFDLAGIIAIIGAVVGLLKKARRVL